MKRSLSKSWRHQKELLVLRQSSFAKFSGVTVGVLDTGVSRSTCSWASSTAQLRSRGETTTEAIEEDPHEEAPHEENDDQNC
jgi:hypothetical protein